MSVAPETPELDPRVRERRASLGAVLLLLQGGLLGLGSGSALVARSGQAPLGARVATLTAFLAYGSIAACAVVLVTLVLVVLHVTGVRSSWPRMGPVDVALPVTGVVAGLGTGFFAGTYSFLGKVLWSLSVPPPWFENLGVLLAVADWVFLPVAVLVAAVAGKRSAHPVITLLMLLVGYEIGHFLASGLESRLTGLEMPSAPHVFIFVLLVIGCAIATDRPKEWR